MRSLFIGKILFALFVGASVSLGITVSYTGVITDVFPANFADAPTLLTLVIFISISFLFYVFLTLLQRLVDFLCPEKVTAKRSLEVDESESFGSHLKERKMAIIAPFAVIVFAWLIVFLNYYPGTSMNDQLWIIEDPVGAANNHPLLYNLALAFCVRVGGVLLNDTNAGFALYVILQMVLCAAIVSTIACWLHYRKAPTVVCALFAIIFAFFPIVSNYSICAIKDTPFAYFMLAWIPFLYEATRNPSAFWGKRSSFVLLAALIMSISLMRNNGLYIAIVLTVVLIIAFRAIAMKKIIASSLLAICLSVMPSFCLSLFGNEQLFRESVGIPLQQICAVVCEDENSLTDEQRLYIEGLLPIKEIQSNYAPMFVDTIKYHEDFDTLYLQDTKSDFIKVYIELGMAHPDIYFRAYLSQTWGYWDITAWNTTQSFFFGISSNNMSPVYQDLMARWGLYNNSLYPDGASNVFNDIYKNAVRVFPGPGLCFFAVLLGAFVMAATLRSGKWLIVILPCILLWLTLLISAPLSCSMRYVFPIFISIPLVWGLAIIPIIESRRLARKHSDC